MPRSPALFTALAELERELRIRVGQRLRLVRLFGSWARCEATERSDIDVAIVIDRLEPGERRGVLDVVRDIEQSSDLAFSAFLMTGERFDALARTGTGIAQAILDEGLPP